LTPVGKACDTARVAIVERRFSALYRVLFAIFVLFGVSMTVIGATLPRILADFRWSYGTAGAVIAAGAIGYFLSTYAVSKLLGRIGPRAAAAVGTAFVALGLALFAASPSPAANFALYAAIGIGQGFLEIVVNWSALRMDPSGRALNLMHGAFSIGAVAGPFVVGFLLGGGFSWILVYRGMAILFGLILLTTLILPFGLIPKEESGDAGREGMRLATGPAYILGFVALFLYVGVEIGISNWASEFFVRVFGSSEATGSFMVSLFWLGLLAGRFGVPLLFSKARQDRVLTALAIGLSISSGALAACGFAGTASMPLAVAAIALAGLSCSSIYPIVVALAGRAFPRSQAKAIGLASAGGGVGSFFFPFLMSRIAQSSGIRMGFAFYAFVAVLLASATFALTAAVRARVESMARASGRGAA
jgi:fucose permease